MEAFDGPWWHWALVDVAWATLGGLATDVRITDRRWSRQAYDGQTVVAEIEIQIQIRRNFTRPGEY